MSPEDNAWHWWNWWVQVATAVGTVGAVIAALFLEFFRDWIRYRFLPPQLRIGLRSTESKEIPAYIMRPSGQSPPHETKSRWYHVTVTNERSWVEATGVQVFLLRVEKPNEADEFVACWEDPLPLKWRHMSVEDPAPTRAVGSYPVTADLVAFYRDATTSEVPFLLLQTRYFPNLFDPHRTGRCKLRLVLAARERQVEYTARPCRPTGGVVVVLSPAPSPTARSRARGPAQITRGRAGEIVRVAGTRPGDNGHDRGGEDAEQYSGQL